jgi:hypothetical protein
VPAQSETRMLRRALASSGKTVSLRSTAGPFYTLRLSRELAGSQNKTPKNTKEKANRFRPNQRQGNPIKIWADRVGNQTTAANAPLAFGGSMDGGLCTYTSCCRASSSHLFEAHPVVAPASAPMGDQLDACIISMSGAACLPAHSVEWVAGPPIRPDRRVGLSACLLACGGLCPTLNDVARVPPPPPPALRPRATVRQCRSSSQTGLGCALTAMGTPAAAFHLAHIGLKAPYSQENLRHRLAGRPCANQRLVRTIQFCISSAFVLLLFNCALHPRTHCIAKLAAPPPPPAHQQELALKHAAGEHTGACKQTDTANSNKHIVQSCTAQHRTALPAQAWFKARAPKHGYLLSARLLKCHSQQRQNPAPNTAPQY